MEESQDRFARVSWPWLAGVVASNLPLRALLETLQRSTNSHTFAHSEYVSVEQLVVVVAICSAAAGASFVYTRVARRSSTPVVVSAPLTTARVWLDLPLEQ
jgi:hypothetical protein